MKWPVLYVGIIICFFYFVFWCDPCNRAQTLAERGMALEIVFKIYKHNHFYTNKMNKFNSLCAQWLFCCCVNIRIYFYFIDT